MSRESANKMISEFLDAADDSEDKEEPGMIVREAETHTLLEAHNILVDQTAFPSEEEGELIKFLEDELTLRENQDIKVKPSSHDGWEERKENFVTPFKKKL